jgi:hypothetical protein
MIFWLWLLFLRLLFLDTDPGGSDGDDDGDSGDDDGDGDGDPADTPPDDAEATKNPKARIRSLLGANARLNRKLKEKDQRIAELETGSDDGALQEARLVAAYWRHIATSDVKLNDAETALDLAMGKGFFDVLKFSEDGEVEGLGEAFARIVERYPWLVADGDEDEEPHPSPPTSGRQPLTRSKDIGATQMSKAKMKERFPALRRRV